MSYNPGFIIGVEYVRDHVIMDPVTKERKSVITHVDWGVGVDDQGFTVMGPPTQAFDPNDNSPESGSAFYTVEKVPWGDASRFQSNTNVGGLHGKSAGL